MSWEKLRAEHDAAKPNLDRSKGLHDFKRWLKRAYAADTSPQNIRLAATAITTVPEEVQRLGYRLREISSRTV